MRPFGGALIVLQGSPINKKTNGYYYKYLVLEIRGEFFTSVFWLLELRIVFPEYVSALDWISCKQLALHLW